MLIKGIYSNSAMEDREQMIKYADTMLQNAMNPQPPPPDPKIELDRERLKQEMQIWFDERDLQTRKLEQQDEMYQAEAKRDIGEGYMQTATAALQMVKAETEQLRAQADSYKALAEARAKEVEASLAGFKAQVEATVALRASEASRPSQEDSESETTKPDGIRTVKRTHEAPTERSSVEDTKIDASPEIESNPVLEKLQSLIENQLKLMDRSGRDSTPLDATSGVFDRLAEVIERLDTRVNGNEQAVGALASKKPKKRSPPTIERGPDGKVASVDGIPVTRDENGLLAGLQEAPPEG